MRYMPTLRVQQSEYLALGALEDGVADEVVPLLYQTPSFDPDPSDVASRRLGLLARQWSRPAFFDPTLAAAHEDVSARELYDIAADCGPYAPAVPLHPNVALAAARAAGLHRQAALRVTDPYVILEPDVAQTVDGCVDNLGLSADQVTLVFDLGNSTDPRAARAVLSFPRLTEWAAVVLVSGAFEPVLTPTSTVIPRTDLENWQRVSATADVDLVFGDYGTLEAAYQEPVSFPPAAKLAYTEPGGWFYVRGRSVLQEGNEQIFELAQRITQRPDWRGRAFSWGDEWIDDRAANRGSAGNAGMWIRAALVHHITHVVTIDV